MAETMLQKANGTTKPVPADEARAATTTPRVDVLETDNELIVMADMPGIRPEDVDIRFENGELTVHGRRACCQTERCREYGESDVTAYYRTFRVTEHVAADKITADMKNGVLTLKLPKVEAVKPRRIAVSG